MPKNLGLYNNDLAVPRKEDVDAVQTELIQLTTDVDTHIGGTNNPHQVTKAQVGLNNVANVLQYSANNPPPYPVTSVNGDTGTVVLGASDVGAVPTTRTVNGKALSSNVTLTASDIGLGNVDNVQQYSASNPPPYPVTSVNSKTGAVSLTYSDVGAVPTSRTVNSKELSSNITLSASDVGALPTQTGMQGQFLGFTANNVVGAVDAPGGVNIQVSASQPTGQSAGDFWYKIV